MKIRPFIEPAGTEVSLALVEKYIKLHQAQVPHYKELADAYTGDYPILSEEPKPDWKPDNRLVVNFAKYITDTMNGFFIGVPITVDHPDAKVSEYLNWLDAYNNQDDKNAELAKSCSIYGRGYELLFTDESGEIGIVGLTPLECFVVADNSVLHRPLFAVRWYLDADNTLRGSVCDKSEVRYFLNAGEGLAWDGPPKAHYFGDVPIVEYLENAEGKGIFEGVLTLINAYNKVLSEKANDVDYYADAYMKILGAKLDEPTLRELRRHRIINFEGEDADKLVVEFMQKPDADGTQEHLIDRLERLIFQISMVTDISEESFGTASGIALKYRLLGMNNLRKTKERKFMAGLNRRYRLIAGSPASPMGADDWTQIRYGFTANFPANLSEEADIAGSLSGITSKRTQLRVLSCVEDVDAELADIAEEADTSAYLTAWPTNRTIQGQEGS